MIPLWWSSGCAPVPYSQEDPVSGLVGLDLVVSFPLGLRLCATYCSEASSQRPAATAKVAQLAKNITQQLLSRNRGLISEEAGFLCCCDLRTLRFPGELYPLLCSSSSLLPPPRIPGLRRRAPNSGDTAPKPRFRWWRVGFARSQKSKKMPLIIR